MSTEQTENAAVPGCPEGCYWGSETRGDVRLWVPKCMICGRINWDEIAEQLAARDAELDRVTGERDEAQRMLANANSRVTEMQQKLAEANAALAKVTAERDTARAVAKSNKRHAEAMAQEVERLTAETLRNHDNCAAEQTAIHEREEWDSLTSERDGLLSDYNRVSDELALWHKAFGADTIRDVNRIIPGACLRCGGPEGTHIRRDCASQLSPTFSQEWEKARDEVLDKAKAWRLLWPLDKPGLDPTTYVRQEVELYAAVDAMHALESTLADVLTASVDLDTAGPESTPDGPGQTETDVKLSDLEGIEPGFTLDLPDLKRRAEKVAPGVSDQIHTLLGCAWGDTIAIKGYSDDRCPNKADEVVVLHQDGAAHGFKLCEPHAKLVKEETTPHVAAAAAVTEPGEASA